jgi:hypothetical protein
MLFSVNRSIVLSRRSPYSKQMNKTGFVCFLFSTGIPIYQFLSLSATKTLFTSFNLLALGVKKKIGTENS